MRAVPAILLAVALLGSVVMIRPALAADDDVNLEFFYPLVTGRPVIERELELKLRHEKGDEGRETDLALALEWPVLPRWQVELEVPFVFQDPRDAASAAGPGDLVIETKFLLLKSADVPALLAAGVEGRIPTGSERRGLGGEASIEPFVRSAIALGPIDLLGEVSFEFNVNAHVHGEHEQTLTAGPAAGYLATRRFTPLLELTTVTRTRGEDEEDGPRIRGTTQIYLTPGLNFRPLPRTTLRLGVQLPVTPAREFDYAIHAGLVREF